MQLDENQKQQVRDTMWTLMEDLGALDDEGVNERLSNAAIRVLADTPSAEPVASVARIR